MSERVAEIEQQRKGINLTRIPYENNRTSEAILLQQKHEAELLALKGTYETKKQGIREETGELINKEKVIHQSKELLYSALGIDNELTKNSSTTNFLKGMIDGLVIGNIDLAIEVINTKGQILLEALKSLISIDGIKQIAKALGENIGELFSGNAYEKGKSSVELILVGTGIASTFKLTKFLVKGTAKIATKLGETGQVLIKKGVDAGKKMGRLSVKEILDLKGYERLITVAGLEIKKRLEVAGELIKRNLTNSEKSAIEAAHKVGESREGAGVGNYIATEIKEKIRILKEAGFSLEERKTLLFEGVCGGVPQAEKISTWKRFVTMFEGGEKPLQEAAGGKGIGIKDLVEQQLKIVTKFRGKSISEVNKILTGEIETIGNSKDVLGRILKDVVHENGEKRWQIQKLANEYIGNKLSNLEKFIEYMEHTLQTGANADTIRGITVYMKNKIKNEGMKVLTKSIEQFRIDGKLILDQENIRLYTQLLDRIKNITSLN